jgi:nitrogen fixation protein NifX
MTTTRIAAVSTDGINVDDHFGKAQRFLIYDLNDQLTFVEERGTESLSVDDPGHAFDADKFNRILSTLKGCSRIYITQIGEMPAAKLKESGIEPVVYSGPIAAITQ